MFMTGEPAGIGIVRFVAGRHVHPYHRHRMIECSGRCCCCVQFHQACQFRWDRTQWCGRLIEQLCTVGLLRAGICRLLSSGGGIQTSNVQAERLARSVA